MAVKTSEAVEALDTEENILPLMENSIAIECVLSSPNSSSAALLQETQTKDDVPVPTLLEGNSPGATSTPTGTTDVSVSTPKGNSKPTPRLNVRRSFTTEFKLECVEHAERTKNKTGTARKYNVNRRRIQEWCTQKDKLIAVPKEQKRLGGSRRRPVLDENKSGLTSGRNSTTGKMVDVLPKPTESPLLRATQGADSLSPDAIMESIVRGLSVADLSILPASMIKMVQDLSAEVASQDVRTSMESMLRETSAEMFLQKGMNSSPRDIQTDILVPEIHGAVEMSDQLGLASGEVQVTKPSAAPDVLADEMMETDQPVQKVSTEDVLATPETPLPMTDITVQSAILDALIQVATSMQMTANDLLQSLTAPASVNPGQEPPTDIIPGPTDEAKEPPIDLSLEGNPNHTITPAAIPEATTLCQVLREQSPISSPNPVLSSATRSMSSLRTKAKKYYTVDFKLHCVAYAESSSKCAAARHFNVDRRRVQDWCAQKNKLLHLKSITSVESVPDDSGIEEQLAVIAKQHLESGRPLTRKIVKDEAVKLFRECGNTTFIPNVGWVARFMIRNNISLIPPSLSQSQQPSAAASEDGDDEYNDNNTCTDS